jgi:hypothetical protein
MRNLPRFPRPVVALAAYDELTADGYEVAGS